MSEDNKTKHILRYGTNAEQKYIEKMANLFDTLAINANMIAYTPGAIAGFIMMHMLKSKTYCGYFIDPITHAFQHDINKISSYSKKDNKLVIKKSISNLIENYGDPLVPNIVNGIMMKPSHFDDKEKKEEFCYRVIDFQRNIVRRELDKKDYVKYLVDANINTRQLEPCFVIPPYFFIDSGSNLDWTLINIDFLNIAKANVIDTKVYVQLVVSRDILLDKSFRDKICTAYIEARPEAVLLWIDNFNEHKATEEELLGFIDIIRQFSINGIKIYNLYGGFFSTILTGFREQLGFNLEGLGHGLEYGESRAVIPVGGGIPTNKYYYYPLHNRIDYNSASRLLHGLGYFHLAANDGAKEYFKNICSCPVCKSIIADDINNFARFENTEFYEVVLRGVSQKRHYASQDTKEICIMHYQYNKIKEFIEVEKSNLPTFIDKLIKLHSQYEKYEDIIQDSLDYLLVWHSVLNRLVKR